MPWTELDNEVSLFYTINPPNFETPDLHTWVDPANATRSGEFDETKPTLVLIPPTLTPLLYFESQFIDPRLTTAFNLVSFDLPLHGLTKMPPQESWSVAQTVDILLKGVRNVLGDRKFVVVAEGPTAASVAALLAITLGEQVKGLVLSSPIEFVPSQQGTAVIFRNEETVKRALCNKNGNGDGTGTIPQDFNEQVDHMLFGNLDRHRKIRKDYGVAQNVRYGYGNPESNEYELLLRLPAGGASITDEQLSSISQPVLLLTGDDESTSVGIEAAKAWQAALKNAKGGADLHIIKGAPLFLLLAFPSANRYLLQFTKSAFGV